MTQEDAILQLRKIAPKNNKNIGRELNCSGDIETCTNDSGECFICSIRDCPYGDFLHYHHDGCPSCVTHVNAV